MLPDVWATAVTLPHGVEPTAVQVAAAARSEVTARVARLKDLRYGIGREHTLKSALQQAGWTLARPIRTRKQLDAALAAEVAEEERLDAVYEAAWAAAKAAG